MTIFSFVYMYINNPLKTVRYVEQFFNFLKIQKKFFSRKVNIFFSNNTELTVLKGNSFEFKILTKNLQTRHTYMGTAESILENNTVNR